MGAVRFLIDRFRTSSDHPALGWRDQTITYGALADLVESTIDELKRQGVTPGSPVVLRGDYHFGSVALLLALIECEAITVPLLPASMDRSDELVSTVDPAFIIDAGQPSGWRMESRPNGPPNAHYQELRRRQAPGLVLFTSGSTGRPKAVVHDFTRLLQKFHVSRPAMITVNFLLFDHWGGINTLLNGLANRCLVVLPELRTADHICELVQRFQVELLPTTPSFLNLLVVSEAYKRWRLDSLRIISYGAEPMPATTLARMRELFPNLDFRQTYGMIELGVLRAKSRSSDSLWVKIGGEGYDVRVVDGILQIKADAAMLGYLNAPTPLTADGYFITGDRVEVDGEYFKILGRDSDLINVGGKKVFPAEVEATILECPGVQDAVAYGTKNALLGNIVCADVVLTEGTDEKSMRLAIKKHCQSRLEPFMVPAKINFVTTALQSDRMKRVRLRS